MSAVLEASDVSYGYRRGTCVLDRFSTHVASGTVTAITGPSGRGKSTLLYLLAGLLRPWSGEVAYRGRRDGSLTDAERARHRARAYGFIFQDAVLDARRPVIDAVLEPCLYAGVPRARYRDRALALLEEMGVSLTASSLPGQISGGQAQRVGVCRALLLEPTVVFADEPTGNLDDASARVVLAALDACAARGSAVLVATHDERVVQRCTHRIQL